MFKRCPPGGGSNQDLLAKPLVEHYFHRAQNVVPEYLVKIPQARAFYLHGFLSVRW